MGALTQASERQKHITGDVLDVLPEPVDLTCGFFLFLFVQAHKRSQILDRKSTRLNSSHVRISYAVFCLKKKIKCMLRTTSRLHYLIRLRTSVLSLLPSVL